MSDTPNKDFDKDTTKDASPEVESAPEKPTPLFVSPTEKKEGAKQEQQLIANKPVMPKPAAATPPSFKPKAPSPKANPSADSSSITFDDEENTKEVSTPMLVIDAVAALVAVTFAILVLRDVMPFL